MCPPYVRGHTQVRHYENIENYTWDTTLGRLGRLPSAGGRVKI
jgi:hypothetical protein